MREDIMCGGTTRRYDKNAPKVIESKDMNYFDVSSALGHEMIKDTYVRYISAFAEKTEVGTFVFFEKEYLKNYEGVNEKKWALIKDDVFPTLVDLVNTCNLAQNNGEYHHTHGLPENFGGIISIKYDSGEKIYVDDNQSPLFDSNVAERIIDCFEKILMMKKQTYPDLSKLKSIHFEEKDEKDGSFKDVVLTILPSGDGINKKKQKFSDPKIYESEKNVSAKTITKIKENILNMGILAWEYLPESPYRFGELKKFTFEFEGGEKITVKSDRQLPQQLSSGFFNIELEMVTLN